MRWTSPVWLGFSLILLAATTLLAQGPPPPPGGQGDGIWLRNAFWGEAQTFDRCVGHQPGNGQYHHHANPLCLRAQLGDNLQTVRTDRTGPVYRELAAPTRHSPILGWSFDGFPIYGPYGYADATRVSPLRRMKSSYRLRFITARQSLPDWALAIHPGAAQQLTPALYGPEINKQFPLGRYLEDYEYVQGLGDLDAFNGRFAVTPEFPAGTYAYFVTIDEAGVPAFPYILGPQYYGAPTGGVARNIPADAGDLFIAGSLPRAETSDALLGSWFTRNALLNARAGSNYDPSATPSETWPFEVPTGVRTSGGVVTPTRADIQRIRANAASVFINSSGLASYTMGPWFDPLMAGGMFSNWPSNQNVQMAVPRSTSVPATKRTTGLGAVGVWVNGVAVFNALDGGSYSNAQRRDIGGGLVALTAVHVSAATFEGGPTSPGALMAAFPLFGATLATTTASATSPDWPTSLGGTTVTVRDSAGVDRPARLSYVSPGQVNYEVPELAASGNATVTIQAGGESSTANIYITPAYPHLFTANTAGLAAAQIVRVRDGVQTIEDVAQVDANGNIVARPIDPGPETDRLTLVLYGTGLRNTSFAFALLRKTGTGVSQTDAISQLLYSGPQGSFPGLDQVNLELPRSPEFLSGELDVQINAGLAYSNTVSIRFR